MFLREVFFSRLYHRKVETVRGRRVGVLRDVAVSLEPYYPTVVGIRIDGRGYIPTVSMAGGLAGEVLRISKDAESRLPTGEEYYAAELLLDRQVLDRRDRRVHRVNDLVFASYGREDEEERAFFAGVDIGVRGVCRRAGMEWLVRSAEARMIGWRDIAMVDDGTVPDCLSLRRRRLHRVSAKDVAEMCRKLDRRHRSLLLRQLPHSLVCKAITQMSSEERGRVLTAFSCEEMVSFIRSLPQELQEEASALLPSFYRYSRQAGGGDVL